MKTILGIIIPLLFLSFIRAAELKVDTTRDNPVKFFANSTFGSFEGVTDEIRGSLSWEGEDTMSTGEVYFEVDLETFDTGIGLRNSHMREKYLETDKFPKAIYNGQITAWQETSAGVYQVESKGTMTIHGVEKSFPATAKLYQTESGYRVVTNLKLDITEFNINKPRFLLTSMDKMVRLRLVFYLKSR